MKRGYLAAVLVVLAAGSSAWADEEPQGSMRTWVDADYLLWWLKPAPAGPALLTTGNLTTPTSAGSGILGASGTSILAGNSYLNQGPYSGFKIGAGIMDCSGSIGGEGSFFYLSQRGIDETFSSGGNMLLARPIIDARTGSETVLFVAAPNAFRGNFDVHSATQFFGADGNALFPFIRCNACYPDEIGKYVTGLAGFAYLNLRDDETLTQSSTVLPLGVGFFNNLPVPPGGNVSLTDDIRTLNQFYGGQIGLKAGISWWRFTLNGVGKVALGSMHETANLSGNTTATSLGGVMTSTPAGLYVLNTNAGSYSRNILAVVPQGTLTVAVELTAQLKLTLGYTIIYISDVARPGDLIDRTINRTELPSSQTFNPTVGGPQRPGFNWSGTDFWAQGINVGLSLRF